MSAATTYEIVLGVLKDYPNEAPEKQAALIAVALEGAAQGATANPGESSPRPTSPRWTFGDNEEVFRGTDHESEAAAIADALDTYPDAETIWVGQIKPVDPKRLFRADHILEAIGERAYDEVGEVAEHWPELSKEDTAELEQLVMDYVLTKSPVTFFTVENSRSYTRGEAEAMCGSDPGPSA